MGLSAQYKPNERDYLLNRYRAVRQETERLCLPLVAEDYVIQTMPDVSPTKWHLAHTSWFFETFLLAVFDKKFKPFHPGYDHLFNSYYVTHGQPFLRPHRGLLSRPTVEEIKKYREWVDQVVASFIMDVSESIWHDVSERVILGLNHEQQHQELILTDIKHVFSQNPLSPVYQTPLKDMSQSERSLEYIEIEGGLVTIGFDGNGFAYDNEGPQHQVYLNDYRVASRLVTNAEYIAFIEDKAYQRPDFWLSEAWTLLNKENWQAPLYWEKEGNKWIHFTLQGMQPVELNAPVCHVSLYEADAFARWAGKRLLTEFEWEHAARNERIEGNFRESNHLKPVAAQNNNQLTQLYGDVWEWTCSAYSAYPGYQPAEGSIGEYNGKFMSGQNVLRGGSFATALDHIRATYRNFFYPEDRWQFSGIRLAE